MKKSLHPILYSALLLVTMRSTTMAQGALSATVAPTSGLNVNLTAEGVTDWSHWGLNGLTQNHKAVGGTAVGLISNETVTTAAASYNDNKALFSWTDGTPTASATNTPTGIFSGDGTFTFTAPAGTASQNLKVYVGGFQAGTQFTAHLSDGSAGDYVDTSVNPANAVISPDGNHSYAVYTVTYKAATAGQTLTITFAPIAGNGNITLQAATLFPTPTVVPAAPTGLTATAGTNRIGLAFNTLTGADSYNLYRATSAGGPFTQIATGLTSNNYQDTTGLTNGTTYYYKVTAVNVIGEGPFSNVASATPQVGIDGTGLTGSYYLGGNGSATMPGGANFNFATATPTFTELDPTVNFSGGGNNVAGSNPWPAAVNAQPNNFSAQWVGAISVPITGSYTFATNSDDGSGIYLDGGLIVNNFFFQGPTTRGSSPITLTAGVKHTLRVPFFQGGGGYTMVLLYTPPGQAQQVIPAFVLFPDASLFAPAPPTLTGIPVNGTSVTLNYNVAENATTFNILRSTVSGAETVIKTGVTGGSFTDTGLTAGTTYYYVVQAVGPKGASGNSNEVALSPVPPVIGNGNGLAGTYYAGGNTDFSAEATTPILFNVVPTINFNAGNGGVAFNPAPFPSGLPGTNFTAVWSGQVLAPFTGPYLFQTITDDGARLTVNGVVQFNDQNGHGPLANTGATINLVAGLKYNILFEYTQGGGGDTAQLLYNPLNSGFVIIPQTQLFPNFTAAPVAPTNLAATGGDALVILTWTGSQGASTYNVYRGTTPGGEGATPIATGVTNTSYIDPTPVNGTTYYYVVKAVNNIGTSGNSNEVSVTPAFPTLVLNYTFENGPSAMNPDPVTDLAPGGANPGRIFGIDVPSADAGFTHDAAFGTYAGITKDATDYIALPDAFDFGNQFTVLVYVKLASSTAGQNIQTILATGGSGGSTGGFELYVNDFDRQNNAIVFETNTGPANGTNFQTKSRTADNVFPFDGKYHAVAAVVNRTSGTVLLYLDGVNYPVDNPQVDTTFPTKTGTNRLGIFGSGDELAANSEFDNLSVYAGLLNSKDIAALSVPVVTGATVTGTVSLEGVTDLFGGISPFAPLGTFRVDFRTPGTMTVVKTANVSLTPVAAGNANGTFSVTGVPAGTYDVLIKGAKNLAVLSSGVVVSATSGVIPAVSLPAGDANNDNSVDSTDFGLLIGEFNLSGAIAGSGYDPAEDFNFDGSVDSTDFGLLIGEFNNMGAK